MNGQRFAVVVVFGVALLAAGCAAQPPAQPAAGASPAAAAPETVDKIQVREFILGNGDTVEISVFRQDELNRTVRLDATGTIMFPLVGDVRVSGKSVHAVRDELQRRLAPFVVNPQVMVNVTGVQSQKVLLLGEVRNPGVYSLDSDLTISEAVGRSGGLTDDAKDGAVLLVRRSSGKQEVTAVDVGKILKRGAVDGDVALGNGDIVYVPKKTIANVSWLMSHITTILSPIVMAETGIVLWPQMIDALEGGSAEDSPQISIPTR